MRCINCYQEIPDNAKFCPQCGAKQPVQKMAPASQVNEDTTTQNVTDDAAGVQQSARETVETEVQQAGVTEAAEVQQQAGATEAAEVQRQAGATETVEEVQKPVETAEMKEKAEQSEGTMQEKQDDPYSNQNNGYQNSSQNWYGGPQNANEDDSYRESNNYQYGQGYNQQNQGYNYNSQQNQGYYQQNNYNGMSPKPVNWVPYLVLSILSTLCCCLPFGVVGIVFSAKINSSMVAGNYEEAQKNAKTARIWIIVSFVLGIITWAIYMMLIVTGTVSGSAYYYYY